MGLTSMITSILGGLGLFLLGMAVMTDGLKALAGSALRSVLARAASTPVRGTIWGAIVTLIVQSSSATTMTTIGLVSAGLLTFPQALGVVFGANIGTTGTGWIVALLGVKVSLNVAAMPMLFAGALLRLLGRGRRASSGGAIAGFSLLLIGLTILQDGMAGLAQRLRPEDLPAVSGAGFWSGTWGVITLVVAGAIMTIVMQSSSAAVAATISALHAGAIAPDQAAALVIGQNIGSAVSSAMAAIGANTPARRTALSHVLFNVVTAVLVLALFPLLAPLIGRWSARSDPTILIATFHSFYNLLGVILMLPVVDRFARLVEHMVPQRGPELTRFLDESVLGVPAVAVEAARRSVACSLRLLCDVVIDGVDQARRHPHHNVVDPRIDRTAEALDRTRAFLSRLAEPPASPTERARLENVLHALDHASRMRETAADEDWRDLDTSDPDEAVAAEECVKALQLAARIATRIAEPASPNHTLPSSASGSSESISDMLQELSERAQRLADLRRSHRVRVLTVGERESHTADVALRRAETMRLLDRLSYHAWRSATRLAMSQGLDT